MWSVTEFDGRTVIHPTFGIAFHEADGLLQMDVGGFCGEGGGPIESFDTGFVVGDLSLSEDCATLTSGLFATGTVVDVSIDAEVLTLRGAGVVLRAEHFESESVHEPAGSADGVAMPQSMNALVVDRRAATAEEEDRLSATNPLDCAEAGEYFWDYGAGASRAGIPEDGLLAAIEEINEQALEEAQLADYLPTRRWVQLTTSNDTVYFVHEPGNWRVVIEANEIGPHNAVICAP